MFKEGGDAYRAGKPKKANPYKHGTVGFIEWEKGWIAAERADK